MLAASIMSLALAAAVQDEGETWESVTFKEGGFVVEMPAIPEQEGTTPFSAPGGQGTLHDRLRQGGGVIYDVKQYESRRPIPGADAGRWLDFARDKEAGFAHGKLVSEKKIQLGSVSGREYFFRDSSGFETRGRAFVKGSTLIVLLASSQNNKPLPPKADRFLGSFAFGTKPSAAGKAVAKAGEDAEDRRKGAAPWKVVPLMGGKATVEMPGQTSRTGGGNLDAPLRRFFSMSTNAEGPGADYSGVVFQGEGGLAAADEAKGLDVARGRAVSNFGSNGKVVSERPIRSGSLSGREYEMTIDRRGGTVKARCRAYIDGGMIFMVIAASKAKGKDLSPEAGRFLDSFALKGRGGDAMAKVGSPGVGNVAAAMMGPVLKLIVGPANASLLLGGKLVASLFVGRRAGPAMATARPPEAGANVPDAVMPEGVVEKPGAPRPKAAAPSPWGTEVDPDGDVAIETSGRSVRMEIPGKPHVLAPERDKMNAPRVVAPARGDFVVTVRVDGEFNPGAKSTVKGLSSRQAGGLVLWKDSGNYLVFQRRASVGDEGKEANQAVLEELVAGKKGITHRQPAQEGPVFLRLERSRGRIAAAFSADGRQWKELKPVDTTWAEGEIQVGVVAVNTSTAAHSVTFEGYSLKAR